MTFDNTDDMPNDNDVQPTIQTKTFIRSDITTLNRNALFQHWLDKVKSNEARGKICRCRLCLVSEVVELLSLVRRGRFLSYIRHEII